MAEVIEKATVVSSFPRGTDLEVAVRRLEVDGEEFIDVREYIPSSEVFGRGITVPASLKKALLSALREA